MLETLNELCVIEIVLVIHQIFKVGLEVLFRILEKVVSLLLSLMTVQLLVSYFIG